MEVAEVLGLPLVVIAPFPLTMTLDATNNHTYNAPSQVPAQNMLTCLSEHMPLLQRYLLSPFVKRWALNKQNPTYTEARNRARAELGLGKLKGGYCQVPPGVKHIICAGITWDLVGGCVQAGVCGYSRVGAFCCERT